MVHNQHQQKNLVEILRTNARNTPDKRAYVYLQDGETESEVYTFEELDIRARAIAAALQQRFHAGNRMLLLYPSGLDFVCGFMGALYAGMVAIPAYPPRRNQSGGRILAIAEDSEAHGILTVESTRPLIENAIAGNSRLDSSTFISSDQIADDLAGAWQDGAIEDDDIAFMQYTSGSTAAPKGVMVSHANIMHNERMIKDAFVHDSELVVAAWLPLFHDMGLIGNTLQPLYMGGACVLMPPLTFLQRPLRWLQAISKYRANSTGGPNFAYDLCVQHARSLERLPEIDLSCWTLAYVGAEPVRAETLDRFAKTFQPVGFRRTALYPCYGLAEATLFVTGCKKSSPPVVQRVSKRDLLRDRVKKRLLPGPGSQQLVGCGATQDGHEVCIVDRETLTRCPGGVVGEIWFGGASAASGYFGNAAATKEIFEAYLADTGEGPFMRTGDLGFIEEGELFVTGRLKDIFIIRGNNYYPQDIEFTVEGCHEGLRPSSCAAFAIDVEGEERLVIATEVERHVGRGGGGRRSGADRSKSADDVPPVFREIVSKIREAVTGAHEIQVHAVVLLRAFSIPKTSSGKIRRSHCKQLFLQGELDCLHNTSDAAQEKRATRKGGKGGAAVEAAGQ